MKTIIFGILLFACHLHALSQLTFAKPADYKEIRSRPLLVLTLELDQKKINRLEKRIKNTKRVSRIEKLAEEIENQKKFVDTYNKNIKKLAEKYMNYHPEIIYMTGREYNKIEKEAKKQKKYTILWYSDSFNNYEDYGVYYSAGVSIPTLNYSRIENENEKIDYSLFIPYFGKNYKTLTKTNMELAFRLMRQHINYIIKNKKKKLSFTKYARIKMYENCNKLAGNDIYLTKKNIGKNTILSEVNDKYKNGKVKLVSLEDIEKIVDNKEDKVVGIVVPYGMSGKMYARIMFVRILLNASDARIYTMKGARMGEYYDGKFRAKEFKEYGKCK